jgi:hypothetical protein
VWTDFDESHRDESCEGERTVRLPGGRTLRATSVLDTYWRFATKRQQLFFARLSGPPPWTNDPVIASFRFTNAYRASDRVSQYLIRNVIYDAERSSEDTFFRIVLFKLFNKIETWERLTEALGDLRWESFDIDGCARVLEALLRRGERIYSAAYIMPPPQLGGVRKHENHLRLLNLMMTDRLVDRIVATRSLDQVFETLKEYPSLGNFLAFQLAIDLNYSEMIDFSEMDFVVAGPGACDGIRKCFSDTSGLTERDVIAAMSDIAEHEFRRLDLDFPRLWGRPLQLIDFQNLFCEVDKYARVMHPNVRGTSGRVRIKQRFTPTPRALPQFYPPKWKIDVPQHLSKPTQRPEKRAN